MFLVLSNKSRKVLQEKLLGIFVPSKLKVLLVNSRPGVRR